jgi:hypothetical protein
VFIELTTKDIDHMVALKVNEISNNREIQGFVTSHSYTLQFPLEAREGDCLFNIMIRLVHEGFFEGDSPETWVINIPVNPEYTP